MESKDQIKCMLDHIKGLIVVYEVVDVMQRIEIQKEVLEMIEQIKKLIDDGKCK